jgi:Na+/proline symporter
MAMGFDGCERDDMSEIEQQQQPDRFTYIARVVFLFMCLFALFGCCEAERAVPGILVRIWIAALWYFPVLGGAIVWKAYRRRQMTKAIADILLSLHGFILMSGGMVMGHIATYAKSADCAANLLK